MRFARKGQTANSKINTYRGYRSYKNIDLNSLDDEEIKVYNRSGWAYDLLNDTDMLLLSQKIDEIHQELYAGKLRLKDGSYLVDVNDKALILTGTRQAPVINFVLLADTKSYKDNQDIVKDVIYESERFRHSEEEFTSFLKFAVSLYKEENLQLFKREDYQYKKTERDTGRRAEISSGFGNDRYSAEFQNRTGNGSKTQISESAIVNTEQGNNRYSKDDTIYDDDFEQAWWDSVASEKDDYFDTYGLFEDANTPESEVDIERLMNDEDGKLLKVYHVCHWFKLVCFNLPFAFFSQHLFIQPLVRRIFKLLFRKDIQNRKINHE